MLLAIFDEGVVEALRHLAHARLGSEILLLVGRGDKTEFGQHRGHRGIAEYEETSLVHALVFAACVVLVLTLNESRQFHALLHVLVLHQFKDDVTLHLLGVEALVRFLVACLVGDDTVLALGHFEIGFRAGHTESIGLRPLNGLVFPRRIGVDGDKEVGLVLVGNIHTALQGQEYIGLARVDNFHVGAVAFDQSSEGQGHVEIDILLLGDGSHGTRVVPSMAGINHQHKLARILVGLHRQRGAEEEQQEDDEGFPNGELWKYFEGFQTHIHGTKIRFF